MGVTTESYTYIPLSVSFLVNNIKAISNIPLAENSYNDHFRIKLLDIEDFIKKNPSTKEISNPIYTTSTGAPTPDGLFSNEIFGITKEERSGIYGYIDLHGYFLHPLIYKKLCRSNSKMKALIHGTKNFRFENGQFIEDENGETGIDFLRKHYNELKINRTESSKRDQVIDFIDAHKNEAFMRKILVLPAYYRDIKTGQRNMGVATINKLYNSIILSAKSLQGADDFGLPTFNAVKGRIQELILAIYDLLCGNQNEMVEEEPGLSKKYGLIKAAGISKSTTLGSRLIITAPQLKVHSVDSIRVDTTKSGVPLHSLCANFKQFMIFQIRRFFENEFSSGYITKVSNGKETRVKVKDPFIQFNDNRIEEEMIRFMEGYSDRFSPVIVELEDGSKVNLKFKGRANPSLDVNEPGNSKLIGRDITWCDIIYMAAFEVCKNRHVLITRYPIDSAYSQFPSRIEVLSTLETEPIYYDGVYYPYYPKITQEDIGTDTSSKFIDSLWISNLMLEGINGDYDGDQVSIKGVHTKEANEEVEKFIVSRLNYIGLDMNCIRTPGAEAYQSLYSLTLYLPNAPKLTSSELIEFG